MFICDKNFSCCNHQYWDGREDVEQDAKECGHLVEVAEVVHGFLKKNGWNDYSCSNCKAQYIGHGASIWNYCPNCGARMDGEENA